MKCYIKLSCIDLFRIHLTFSPVNFYQHHNFYNRLMSSPRKNDVTYSINSNNSQARVTVGCEFTRCSDCRLRFASSEPKDKYDIRVKQGGMVVFFQLLNYFLCRFASRFWHFCQWATPAKTLERKLGKLGNPVFVRMLLFKTEVKMTVPEKAKLSTHIKKNMIFFKDNLFSLVSSETERWMECLGALWFKTDLFCVHDLCAAIQNVDTHQEMS